MTTYKDPWADAANQAVGALYKYYLTKPSEAEMQAERLKAQRAGADLNKVQLDNRMNQRLYDMGGYAGMPASAQEYLMTQSLGGDSDAAKRFEDIYVTKPSWQDFGDTKSLMGVNGPMQQYSVGAPPRYEMDKENNLARPVPAINSKPMPIVDAMMPYLVQQESGGNPNAVSPKGAQGLTQVMPSTAIDPGYGVPDIFQLAERRGIPVPSYDEEGAKLLLANPDLNFEFGRNYLGAMGDEFGNNPDLMAAGYNAGPGAVKRAGGIPQNNETPQYVENVAGPVRNIPSSVDPNNMPVINYDKPPADVVREGDAAFNRNVGMDDLNNTFASAIYNINEGGSGFWSFRKDVPFVGGQTTAGALEADIAKLTAKAAVDEIARLKSESKTGGFFGNLSDGERQAVADAQAAIRQDMDPKELAYRIMVFQDMKNDIIHGRGKQIPGSNQIVPIDYGAPRTGMPTVSDIQNAQSPDEIKEMWDAFRGYPVFEGEPPPFIANALEQRYMELR